MPKTNELKILFLIGKTHLKCNIYHYIKFLDKEFRFEPTSCNGYHDVYWH